MNFFKNINPGFWSLKIEEMGVGVSGWITINANEMSKLTSPPPLPSPLGGLRQAQPSRGGEGRGVTITD